MPLEPPTLNRPLLHVRAPSRALWLRFGGNCPLDEPVEQHRAAVIAHLGSIAGQETPRVAVLGGLARSRQRFLHNGGAKCIPHSRETRSAEWAAVGRPAACAIAHNQRPVDA